jgi:hypothetical protein
MEDPAEREASLHFDPISQETVPVGGRLAARWFRIHQAERWVGAPLVGPWRRAGTRPPLRPPGDRVAISEKAREQRLPFKRRLRLCNPEVATANSSEELTVGS